MHYRVRSSSLAGEVLIPGSKSHTIRALVLALLASGQSVVRHPLDSSDTRSCLDMVRRFGAAVDEQADRWVVTGLGGTVPVPDDIIDVGNSGTTLYFGMGVGALAAGAVVFTGDHQIRNRPADKLIASINDLGGRAFSTRGNGKPPVVVQGPLRGGATSVEAVTSQYLSSLLIAAPLVDGETVIAVPLLNEKPYVTMTLRWLEKLGVRCENDQYRSFRITGGQRYRPFDEPVPADFSSATFFMVAAAVTGATLTLTGLDFRDTQGDKEVVNILEKMGCAVDIKDRAIVMHGGRLTGGTFDLNAIPDALPALAVAGACAAGETRLVNVAQARVKETDRIAVMCRELAALGAAVEELPDGLVIRQSRLRGARVNGHGDHRVVMSLAVAGLVAEGDTVIDTAESVSVTFPHFADLMRRIGADIKEES